MSKSSKLRVIVADDQAVVRVGVMGILGREPDMDVVADVEDGEQAVAAFEARSPDVMIVDLRMPKFDGLEVVRRVHARDPRARLLIFSAYDASEAIRLSFEYGALGFVSKGVARQELVTAVRAVSRGTRYVSSDLDQSLLQAQFEPRLTPRVQEILRLLAAGYTNKAIARELGIAPDTVKVHVRTLFQVMNIDSREKCVSAAAQRLWLNH